ncbi:MULTISPECIES: hypothetical protein [Weissella]|uniref:hypothetical protein n=1 Tax=Weissella TaxID=46255 RepID=UPI001081F120|nr:MULTISPECIES: hypothetical protein [Weissella]MBJ7689165.1 hypothetical protein [Weissella confusa]MCT0014377.1 hypothetical protein [Weissella confusa]MCW0927893.1 hypothetical protein [Weissella sp. LMG 11983]MDA5459021.1 hypothetical protein [Weissella confusa]TGE55919.1 hypothetical protein C6P21_11090 [Weissella confusa]
MVKSKDRILLAVIRMVVLIIALGVAGLGAANLIITKSAVNDVRTQQAQNKKKLVKALNSQNPMLNKLNGATTTVFSAMTTYHSQADYNARKSHVKAYLTDDAYKSNDGFQLDPDKRVEHLQLNMSYVDSQFFPTTPMDQPSINGQVFVQYSSWHTDKQPQDGYVVYNATYDTDQNKFSEIKYVGQYNITQTSANN